LDTRVSALRQVYGRVFGPIPLRRLAVTHALGTGADAFFAVSLAGSLFFNVSTNAARPRVIGYLFVTLVPFVVLAPLVGPLIDRFGRARRLVAASTCLGRGILCLFVSGDIRNLLLYPEAFGILILEKAYAVTKSALVPSLVSHDADLVAANSRLSRISTVAGLVGGALAVGLFTLAGASPVLRVAALVYFGAAVAALSIPPDDAAPLPPTALEREELRRSKVRYAAGAMTVLRGAIGFLVFLVAFALKRTGAPTWHFGAIAAASIAGGLVGTIASPPLRNRMRRDEPLLAVALAAAALVSIGAAVHAVTVSIAVAVFAITCTGSMGRQGFDSILQRDAPDAARGRSFARFETLFQLVWVIGALAAVVLQPSARTGLIVLGIVLVPTLITFLIGTKRSRRQGDPNAETTG
jgi:MFS family permease